jgi:hypothetical protein
MNVVCFGGLLKLGYVYNIIPEMYLWNFEILR